MGKPHVTLIDFKIKVIDYLIKERCSDHIILFVMESMEKAYDLGFETSEEMERRIEEINNDSEKPKRKNTIWKRVLLSRRAGSSKKI